MKYNIISPQVFEKRKIGKPVNLNFPFSYSTNDISNEFSEKQFFQPKISVDIFESKNELRVIAEIPGVGKGDIELIIHKHILILKGNKKRTKELDEGAFHMLERNCGHFNRSIKLPFAPVPHTIELHLKDGILTLTIKKDKTGNRDEEEKQNV